MRAIVIEQTGGPDVMQVRDMPEPTPGPGELVVRVGAAGVNFIDTYERSGLYPRPLPYILGKEAAGTVVAVGPGQPTDEFAPGDRVAWAMGTGCYAEQATVPAALAVRIPDGTTDELAAAVMLQGMTAHFLASSVVPLEAGDVVLLHAGAGGVGLLLTQLLARIGVRVITTCSTPEKAELSRAAGAAVVAGYDDFVDAVRDYTDGRGVRAVLDGVGATTFDRGLDCLKPRGTMVLFGASSGPVPPVDPQVLNTKGSLMLTRPSLGHFIADRDELQWRAGEVLSLVASGELDVRIGGSYPLADAARAHEDLAGRRTTGKLVLQVP